MYIDFSIVIFYIYIFFSHDFIEGEKILILNPWGHSAVPSEFLDLDGILSLVISKISFIPKHFGEKFYQIYSSASLIDPCYFTSTWAIPMQTLHTPAADETRSLIT